MNVTFNGYISMPAKTKIAAGYKKLATGENNTVAVSTSGREYLVVNSTATSVGFIL